MRLHLESFLLCITRTNDAHFFWAVSCNLPPNKALDNKGLKKRTIVVLSVVWMTAMVVVTPQYALEWSAVATYCVIRPQGWETRGLPKSFNACVNKRFVFLNDYYIPLCQICIFILVLLFNCFLFFKIVKALGQRSVADNNTKTTNSTNTKLDSIRIQVTKTLVANGIIFFVCQFSYRWRDFRFVWPQIYDYPWETQCFSKWPRTLNR